MEKVKKQNWGIVNETDPGGEIIGNNVQNKKANGVEDQYLLANPDRDHCVSFVTCNKHRVCI